MAGTFGFTTIRGRIAVASVSMALITAGLGTYATVGVHHAGGLVMETYDHALMSISYARAATKDVADLHAFFAREQIATTPESYDSDMVVVDRLKTSFEDDISVATERATSDAARAVARRMRDEVAAWIAARRSIGAKTWTTLQWEDMDRRRISIEAAGDELINIVAGDGFSTRQKAIVGARLDGGLTIGASALAILLASFTAWLLARRIIRPLREASDAAVRIAGGDLGQRLESRSGDEIGTLMTSMETMRGSIETMMATEKALRSSAQARIADAVEGSQDAFIVVDADGLVALANRQASMLLGLDETIAPGTPVAGIVASQGLEDSPALAVIRAPEMDHETAETEIFPEMWVRTSRTRTREGGYVAITTDVTLEKEQNARIEATNQDFDSALTNMTQGLCLISVDGRIRLCNARFPEMFGLEATDVATGRDYVDVLEAVARSIEGEDAFEARKASFTSRFGRTGCEHVALLDGRSISVSYSPTPCGGQIVICEDATDRVESQRRIAHMADHDTLTGLPNRKLLAEKLGSTIARMDPAKGFSLMYLDLDRFKAVNDTMGHPAGDELLRQVAKRLVACVRDRDTVARLGGDEFAIILTGAGRGPETEIVASRIVASLSTTFRIGDRDVSIGTSIGITCAPKDGSDADDLLKHADVALYRAKAEGRGTWRFFETEMDERIQARRLVEEEIRGAIVRDEFELNYQPLMSLQDDAGILGYEALVRWRHPVRGLVPPVQFIAIAEEIGAIVDLGAWVLRTACRQIVAWGGTRKVAVNVSPVQLREADFVDRLRAILSETGCDPRLLEIEVTESTVMADAERMRGVLMAIHALGVRIAMDDFGTGHSSLSNLHRFPFDKIKIDRSFVSALFESEASERMVEAIVAMGRALKMRITAEGVEDAREMAWLKAAGVHEAQGYLISRPVPVSETDAVEARWAAGMAEAA